MHEEYYKLVITKNIKNLSCDIIINFPDNAIFDTIYFRGYKTLLKFLKEFFKSSIEFNNIMKLLNELELKVNNDE